ncbi:MAG: carbohydrate ABC transporter permease [Acidimicrobiales bacterium]
MSGEATSEVVGYSNPWVSRASGLIAWLFALVFVFPVFWMVLTSFKTEDDAQSEKPNFVFDASFDRYREVTEELPGTLTFFTALGNSLWIVLLSTAIVLVLAIPAAYSLAIRPVEKWRDVLFFFISTKFLPIAAAVLPLYYFADFFGLIDTRTVLVILYTAMNLPLAVWMMRSFFSEVPRELIEASQIDGASLFGQLRSVVLPIVSPGIAATALLCFIFAWNEYFLAVNMTVFDSQTMPIWVTTNVNNRGLFFAKLSAASTLACIPVVAAGWMAQKKLVRGLAMGAIK